MKKLMIAAASAAMIGGAFADTAYTFTASLKTTVGKSGKVTTTYNLGKDTGNVFWYNDGGDIDSSSGTPVTNRMSIAALQQAYPNYFTTKKISGSTIPCLTAAAKADVTWLKNTFKIGELAAIYDQKSANKWCETVKVTESGCYRVAGTKKFSGIVVGDTCCDGLTFTDVSYDFDLGALKFSQRFGGLTYAAAKKAEIYSDSVELEDFNDGRYFEGALAGQGSVGKVLDSNDPTGTVDGVTSISGNIVGYLDGADCKSCCSSDTAAVAFACGDDTPNDTLETAAYGTFSLKYNAKETKAL